MNLRHAAALALVGWYLMLPPLSAPGKFDTAQLLSKWVEDSAHDSGAACEQAKDDMVNTTGVILSLVPKSA
jgi:hypothetical protein